MEDTTANEVSFPKNQKLEQCETELGTAKETIKKLDSSKAKQIKELRLIKKEIEKGEKIQKIYEKGLREMMYIISHKVRQPIAKIMGLSTLLEDGIEDAKDVMQIITYMKESSILLDGFTKELTLFVQKLESLKK
jgi:light-regulated signal transduction histidine kinase (bacteriophytochrome)